MEAEVVGEPEPVLVNTEMSLVEDLQQGEQLHYFVDGICHIWPLARMRGFSNYFIFDTVRSMRNV